MHFMLLSILLVLLGATSGSTIERRNWPTGENRDWIGDEDCQKYRQNCKYNEADKVRSGQSRGRRLNHFISEPPLATGPVAQICNETAPLTAHRQRECQKLQTTLYAQDANSGCKPNPGSTNWPKPGTWTELNKTIEGNLLAPIPPAIVCDPESVKHYSASACENLNKVWLTEAFHDSDPVSLHQCNWQENACLPSLVYNGSDPCNLAPFAKYVVNASAPQHIQAAVQFASKHNLRVSIKNTGHDYLGRSTSPGFQIWTHYLRDIEFHRNFQPKGCSTCESYMAVTVGGGVQYAQLYNFTASHDILVAGGAEPSVGVAGHFTGGGHSPLSSLFGLAVDNALEVQAVLPSGELVTANACQNKELFWAMRGGGGSTFGVLVSVTMKAHQNVPSVKFNFTFTTDGSQDSNLKFVDLLVDLHSDLIHWSDRFVAGYFSYGSLADLEALSGRVGTAYSYSGLAPSTDGPLTFYLEGYGVNQSLTQLNSTIWPFVARVNATRGIQGVLNSTEVSDSNDLLRKKIENAAGYNAILGSRLWDKQALLDRDGLRRTFKSISPYHGQGLLVSGPAVRKHELIEQTSATPAWRDAYLHVIVATGWGFRNETAAIKARQDQTRLTKAIQDHAPYTGAYLNEADAEQPNPGATFWGDRNYQRLLKLKRKIDPKGMFWCIPCVGNEDWSVNESTGQLCPAP